MTDVSFWLSVNFSPPSRRIQRYPINMNIESLTICQIYRIRWSLLPRPQPEYQQPDSAGRREH